MEDFGVLGRSGAPPTSAGEGTPAKGLAQGLLYIQLAEGKAVGLWEGQGVGKEAVHRLDFTGTPADGSVSDKHVAGANKDGNPAVPSMRTLDTDGGLVANSDIHVASQKATKTYVDNRVTPLRPMRPASGSFLVPAFSSLGTTALTAGLANSMFLLPVDVIEEKSYDRLGCNVTVKGEGAGQGVRLGLYADDGTGAKPTGNAVVDSGLISTLETGEKLFASEQKLAPGRWWLAFVLQGTITVGPTIVTMQALASTLGLENLSATTVHSLKQAGVSGALPAIGTLTTAGTIPLLGLRVK